MKLQALLLSAAVLSGCATQPGFKALPDSVPTKAKTIETVLHIEQKELNADIVVSNTAAAFAAAGVFGIIPAMAAAAVDSSINNSRTKDAELAVTPVRDALVDFNTNEVLRRTLEAELKTLPWTGGAPASINTTVTKPVREKHYADSKHDGLLFVDLSYRLSPDFKTLTLYTSTNLYPRSADLVTVQKALYGDSSQINTPNTDRIQSINSLYTHNFNVSLKLPAASPDITSAGKAWAENGGQPIRDALGTGAQLVARLIAADLSKPVALTPATANTLIKKEPYTLEVNGKQFKVTQSAWGHSTVEQQTESAPR